MSIIDNLISSVAVKWIKSKLNLQEGSMDDTKKWYQSQTIWAGVAATARGIYLVLQVTLPAFGVHLPSIPPLADGILSSLLGSTVVHGRYTADTTIE